MKLQPPRHSHLHIAFNILMLACSLAQPAQAQTQSPSPTAQPQPFVQASGQKPAQPVRLNVSVTEGAANNLVADLRQEDFRIEEDGVPQVITSFAREELPVSYALVVDNSGSTRNVLEYLIRAGEVLVSANKPADETMIVRFVGSDQISVMQEFTDNKFALVRAFDAMHIEGGQTAILDAVYLAATRVGERRREETARRRAIILFTDGEDRSSYYKQSEVQKLLHQLDMQVFAVGIVANLSDVGGFQRKSPQEKAHKLLNGLTQNTGGRAFYPKNVKELKEAVDAITRELRTQYVIGYQSSSTARDGKFRKVQVKLNETANSSGAGKRTVHVRAGYFAAGAKVENKSESKEKSPRLKFQ